MAVACVPCLGIPGRHLALPRVEGLMHHATASAGEVRGVQAACRRPLRGGVRPHQHDVLVLGAFNGAGCAQVRAGDPFGGGPLGLTRAVVVDVLMGLLAALSENGFRIEAVCVERLLCRVGALSRVLAVARRGAALHDRDQGGDVHPLAHRRALVLRLLPTVHEMSRCVP